MCARDLSIDRSIYRSIDLSIYVDLWHTHMHVLSRRKRERARERERERARARERERETSARAHTHRCSTRTDHTIVVEAKKPHWEPAHTARPPHTPHVATPARAQQQQQCCFFALLIPSSGVEFARSGLRSRALALQAVSCGGTAGAVALNRLRRAVIRAKLCRLAADPFLICRFRLCGWSVLISPLWGLMGGNTHAGTQAHSRVDGGGCGGMLQQKISLSSAKSAVAAKVRLRARARTRKGSAYACAHTRTQARTHMHTQARAHTRKHTGLVDIGCGRCGCDGPGRAALRRRPQAGAVATATHVQAQPVATQHTTLRR
jgi:hypothetical protein